MRLFVVASILLLSGPSTFAQDAAASERAAQTYMVLPVTENDAQLQRLRRLTDSVGRELARRGLAHLPYSEAADAFQKRHSREPHAVSRESIDELVLESQRASRAAANHHANETKQVVAQAQARGADALESLNRDEAAARAYFAACLAHIRVLVGGEERDKAMQVARDCQAAVPGLAPSPHDHPPSVMQVFDDVERMVAAEGTGTLEVESQPTDCRVLLNGRLVGTTPYARQAARGHHYGVQVECGDPRPGRVHEVTLGEAPVALAVDIFFERSVRTTRNALRLVYERPEPSSARTHAAEIARILGADEVVLVAADDAHALVLQMLHRGTSARIMSEGDDELRAAVEALLSDPPPAPVQPQAPISPSMLSPRSQPVAPPTQRLMRTATALAGIGIALGGLSVWSFIEHRKDGDTLSGAGFDTFPGDGRRWRISRALSLGLVGAGSALSGVGASLLATHVPRAHRRWLAPVLAATAVGVLAAGVVDIRQGAPYTDAHVERRRNVRDQERRERGAMLAISSLPLFAASLAQLAGTRDRTISVHATTRSIGASLRF